MIQNKYYSVKATGTAPSGIQYQRIQPTVQHTSYRTGDAGWHQQNGTYNYNNVSNPATIQELDKTLTGWDLGNYLKYNNVFGHKQRFTGITGGYWKGNQGTGFMADVDGNSTTQALAFPDSIIVDHLTGLAWFLYDVAQNWNNSIDTIHGVNFFGYTDWRLPTIQEQYSWLRFSDMGSNNDINFYRPFSSIAYTALAWTSTTRPDDTATALYLHFSSFNRTLSTAKTTATPKQYYCRNYY